MTAAVLHILNEKGDVFRWNSTLIILIPKMVDPSSPKDFRPVSLCNVCYNIVSCAITNRFRSVLNQIVDQFQSVFILRRLMRIMSFLGLNLCIRYVIIRSVKLVLQL